MRRLSSRSFERLTQALLVGALGSAVSVFGDGPDGGREATFEGVLTPLGLSAARGYLVAQAKFLQRPRGDGRDGQWALKELRGELEALQSNEQRRRPDVYLFATNVVLTPVELAGSKDLAASALDDAVSKGLIGSYVIWDYDTLCALIDNNQAVRRRYAAWTTPGDVLAAAVAALDGASPDLERLFGVFLQKELIAEQYVQLEQAGHAAEERIPIARVFVDLPAFPEPHPAPDETDGLAPGIVAEIVAVADEMLDAAPGFALEQTGTPQRTTLRERRRYVLVGGPGEGKTTVGQFVCQLHRAALLSERGSVLPETRAALTALREACDAESIALPRSRRFPLRIVLSEFATALDKADGELSLLNYIVSRVERRVGDSLPIGMFRRWLAEYPWLIVLDGLDEVPPSSNRDAVLAAIQDFWVDVAESEADVFVLATTRPQGYSGEFPDSLYRHRWLAPLAPARARHYAGRLVDIRYAGDQDKQATVRERLDRALGEPATSHLMRTPLQVTIMAQLVERVGRPPQERWSLFSAYYNVVFDREIERDIPAAALLREYRVDVDDIHRRVALVLQSESERAGGTEARMSAERLEKLVDQRLGEEGHVGPDARDLRERLLEAAVDRLVFLVGMRAGEVGFEIRSLQEFMAAAALMEGRDEILAARLRAIALPTSWRNVFLFAAGKCRVDRRYLRDTLNTICDELNDPVDDDVAHASRAGSLLAIDLLVDGAARGQPKYGRLLTRTALRVLERPPSSAVDRLVEAYAPEFDELYREEVEHALARFEADGRGGAWRCVEALARAGVAWADELAERRGPSSAALADRAIGGLGVGSGWSSRFAAAVGEMMAFAAPPADLEGPRGRAVASDRRLTAGGALDLATRHEGALEVRLKDARSEAFRSYLMPVAEAARVVDPGEPPPAHADSRWHTAYAAASFAADPSGQALAVALGRLADIANPGDWDPLISPMYWPLSACLVFADSAEALRNLADAAAAGALGSRDDWVAAEERWRRQGVSLRDVAQSLNGELPITPEIREVGFPVTGCSWLLTHQSETGALDMVMQWLRLATRPRDQAMLASWALRVAGVVRRLQEPALSLNDVQYILSKWHLVVERAQWSVPDAALAFGEPSVDVTRWTDAVDELGRRRPTLIHDSDAAQEVVSLLAPFLEQAPDRDGLWRILAMAAASGTPTSAGFVTGEMTPVKGLIAAMAGGVENVLPQLLRDLVAQDEAWIPHVERALGARDPTHRESMLLDLDRLGLPDPLERQVADLLVEILVRRPSDLARMTKWAELGLFEPPDP